MATQEPGRIVTFYSYKGGTGRSMALANAGWILASRGHRVLLIDWDLEAPGLASYFHPFLPAELLGNSPGVIDFAIECSEDASQRSKNARGDEWPPMAEDANILRYVLPIFVSKSSPPSDFGLLHFIPAGRQGASYASRVNTFNWQHFYSNQRGREYLDKARQQLRETYDYVLIDSRTGVSDTAGICTVHLPDMLAIFFTANTQNMEGAARVASSVWRQWREDPRYQRFDKRIYPFVTRVETSELDKLDTAREHVRARFDGLLRDQHVVELDQYWVRAETPYVPFYAFEEVLAVFKDRSGDAKSVLGACEHVVERVTGGRVTSLKTLDSAEREEILGLYRRTRDGVSTIATTTPSQPSPVTHRLLRQARAVLVRRVSMLFVASVSCVFLAILGVLWVAFALGPSSELEQLRQQLSDEQLKSAQKIGDLTSVNVDLLRKNVEFQERILSAGSNKADHYNTCRNPSFGQVGWTREETVSRSSGWMGGGQSQPDWCNRVIAEALRTRSIGSEHMTKVVQSSEQGRWTGVIGRTREYNYSCTVLLQWDPLYAEKADPVCGKTP